MIAAYASTPARTGRSSVLMKDERIEYRPAERAAVIACNVPGQRPSALGGAEVLSGFAACHDVSFLRELGMTRWLRLDGELTGIDPL